MPLMESVEASRRAFDVTGPHLVIGLVSGLCTILCVLVHYEAMHLATRVLPRTKVPQRARVVGLILTLLVAHVVEVWIFGLTYWLLDPYPALGRIEGPFDEGALDFIYFSVVTFSTLGFGDLVPAGPISILCGTEALVGLSFIAWTASIAFVEMQRDWIDSQGSGQDRP
ncbi:MAG: potassium channel family protein [Planctomycetota bacterium]